MARKDTQFKEGHKMGKGRPKGSPNRTTAEMREALQKIVDKQLENLEKDLMAMSPRNRWDIITKLTSYVIPTLSKNDNTNITQGGIKIMVEYQEPPTQLDAPVMPMNLANQEPEFLTDSPDSTGYLT